MTKSVVDAAVTRQKRSRSGAVNQNVLASTYSCAMLPPARPLALFQKRALCAYAEAPLYGHLWFGDFAGAVNEELRDGAERAVL